jgi:hypothetical protein
MKEKLKIGILLDKYFVPSWKYQILHDIKNSDYARIVIVICDNSSLAADRQRNRIAIFLIKLIEKADRAIFKTKSDFKLEKNVAGLFEDIHTININTGINKYTNGLGSEEITTVRTANPDIILKFGFPGLSGDILKIPKYGVWIYSFDGSNRLNLPDPGFLEVVKHIPVTNSFLGILRSDSGTKGTEAIYNSGESTCQFSININRDALAWRSALFAPRMINGIYKHGEDYLTKFRTRFEYLDTKVDSSLSPLSVADAVGSMFRYFGAVAKKIISKIFYTDAFSWQLLYNIHAGTKLYSSAYNDFRKISSPPEIFWADPFVIAEEDGYYIFVEEFIYKKNRAHISVLSLDKEGNFINSRKIIERPYHMSYPFVFKIDNTYYMVPETSKNRTIELYKCTGFPDKWEFERNIMENISAVDTTFFHYNDKWWLFSAIDQTANISGCSTELFLFFTGDILSGKWESHPLNPVVSDIRSARPAGKIFIEDGKICRPSQNCAGRYGVGFNINHITKLTENEYEEHVIAEVKPSWDRKLRGTHTLNFDKDFTVIDVYSFRRRFSF